MHNEFTAVFRKVPEGSIGFVEELPGTNTQGDTREEARANLEEAVRLVLEANRVLAEEEIAGADVVRDPLRGCCVGSVGSRSSWGTVMQPETRYARSGDVHIAHQVVGDGLTDLVVAPGRVSHVDLVCDNPLFERAMAGLASFGGALLVDRRGTGLSECGACRTARRRTRRVVW